MDYIPAILILCGIIALETCGWVRTLYKQWQREQMRRQKPIRYPLYDRDGEYVRGDKESRYMSGKGKLSS